MTRRRLDRHASLTAQLNAAQRAGESLRPAGQRLLDDPYARLFVTRPGLRMLLTQRVIARLALEIMDRLFPGLHAHIVLRVRYVDTERDVSRRAGIDQIVLLGAGFDSTILRAEGPPLTIYEIDAPPTQRAKRAALQRHRSRSLHQVRWIACDFEHDDFGELLLRAGFDATRPSLIIWMGVSFYLTASAFEATLHRLSSLCAPTSRLVVDYGDPEIIDASSRWPGARRASRMVARRGEPYRRGFTPAQLESALARNGFHIRDHARVPDLARRFASPDGSWCSTDDWLGIASAERATAE